MSLRFFDSYPYWKMWYLHTIEQALGIWPVIITSIQYTRSELRLRMQLFSFTHNGANVTFGKLWPIHFPITPHCSALHARPQRPFVSCNPHPVRGRDRAAHSPNLSPFPPSVYTIFIHKLRFYVFQCKDPSAITLRYVLGHFRQQYLPITAITCIIWFLSLLPVALLNVVKPHVK